MGAGSLSQLSQVVSGKTALLVTDKGLLHTGIVEAALTALSHMDVTVFSDVVADPPEAVVMDAAQAACGKDFVIGLGGGSSLDVAKLAALLACGEALGDIYGVGNVKGPRLPLVLIPTTAGTGSEVTPISIVTTGASEKMGVVSPVILPDAAILDPELTVGLPAHVTAATGIDAMVHAIEAYASASPNNNPVSRGLAKEALRLMGGALLKAVNSPNDIEARSDMLLGSLLAGQAFANSPVAAVHALAYPIGGHYKVPHGLSNALVLPHVLRFNAVTAPGPYAEIADCAFPDLAGLEGQEAAAAFIDRMEQLCLDAGLNMGLRHVGVDASALDLLARDAMNQTRLLVNNPREVTLADARAIYEAAL